MKTKIMLTLVKAEYFDTGHEIENLSMLNRCRIVSVEGGDQEAVVLTVDDAAKQGECRKTVRPKRAVQQRRDAIAEIWKKYKGDATGLHLALWDIFEQGDDE